MTAAVRADEFLVRAQQNAVVRYGHLRRPKNPHRARQAGLTASACDSRPGRSVSVSYHLEMGVNEITFEDFVALVREPLVILDVEPAFQHKDGECARFMRPPLIAELQLLTPSTARLSISAHGELIRTIELPLTHDAVWLAWNGIVAIFDAHDVMSGA